MNVTFDEVRRNGDSSTRLSRLNARFATSSSARYRENNKTRALLELRVFAMTIKISVTEINRINQLCIRAKEALNLTRFNRFYKITICIFM